MYQHILVTGGAGFAGTALCLALQAQGAAARVTALDNLKRRGSELNLPRLKSGGVEFVHGDVRSLDDLRAVRPAPDLIIECSAEPSAQAGYGGSPDYLMQTNFNGCYHCLELARETKADFLFLSTSRVYPYPLQNELRFTEGATRFVLNEQEIRGASAHGIAEEFPLDGPRSLYGMTKLAAELMVQEYADAYGLRTIIDRFGVLTGPHQMGKTDQGVIALWVAAHYYGRPLSYIGFGGTGKQVRDFLHVDDFCDLVLDQVHHFDAYRGGCFNAGGGVANSLSLCELTALCGQVTGRQIPLAQVPDNRPADVRIYLTDHRRVTAVRGWHPRRDAAQTIGDIHRWIAANAAELRPILAPDVPGLRAGATS